MHQSGMHKHVGQQRPRLNNKPCKRCGQFQPLECTFQAAVKKLQHDFQQRGEDKYCHVDVNQLNVYVPSAERFFQISYNSHFLCSFFSNTLSGRNRISYHPSVRSVLHYRRHYWRILNTVQLRHIRLRNIWL